MKTDQIWKWVASFFVVIATGALAGWYLMGNTWTWHPIPDMATDLTLEIHGPEWYVGPSGQSVNLHTGQVDIASDNPPTFTSSSGLGLWVDGDKWVAHEAELHQAVDTLEIGMSYDQVLEHLGCDGQRVRYLKTESIDVSTYEWHGGGLTLSFDKNALSMISLGFPR